MQPFRIACALFVSVLPVCAAAAEDELAAARRLLLQGRYSESAAIYAKSAAKSPAAAVGFARAWTATGKREEAVKALDAAGEDPAVEAELARLALARGDHEAAAKHADAAIRASPDQLLARWIRSELLRVAGRLDEANKAYKGLVEYYNGHDVKEAESLHWIGLAAAQYARWNRLSDQFSFLVNELYPDALKADHLYWPAHYEAGLLFAEKYNRADAAREFQAALELNPGAAEVHAAVARLAFEHRDVEKAQASLRRAVELNPRLPEARLLEADLAWANFQPEEAAKLLEEKVLPLNPVSEEALGRLAASYVLRDGLRERDQSSRFAQLVKRATGRNEHAGEFYFHLAAWLAERNRFAEAERFFAEASRRMPQLVGPKTQLGLLVLRTNREAEARRILEEAFKVDPFNVRVHNSLELLEVMDSYETLQTEHAALRFDPKSDKLLARYVAREVDRIYPELCRQFGYRPPEKPLVEIFNRAKGVSGHDWFSTRMIGLPYLGAVAASTGHIVAMTSPNDAETKSKFNWAQVLRHELVHVVTLQQTGFNMPHWYTEGLAVWSEGYPRPQLWNELLAQRVPQGKLFDLRSLNFAFTRPQSSDDWQMAYCQADLLVEYLLESRRPEVLQRLATAYAENLSTPQAIQRACGVSEAEFERGYVEFLKRIAAEMKGSEPPRKESFADLLKAQRERPEDLELAAELAYAYFLRGADDEARQTAEKVLKLQPKHPRASYVLARLHARQERPEQAIELLQQCLDPKQPDLRVVNLLASLKLGEKKYNEAADLYRLGAKLDPHNLQWTRSLVRLYQVSKEEGRLSELLARIGESDPDDFAARKRLAETALAKKDYPAAVHWSNRALEIDVTDAEVHRAFAVALAGSHNYAGAVEEFQTAVDLDPKGVPQRIGLAEALFEAGRPREARQALEALRKIAPSHPGMKQLTDKIEKTDPRAPPK